jgi:hypothetical protein
MESLRIISAGSHVVEPANLWETRLERKYRDQAPKVVRTESSRWVISDTSQSLNTRKQAT